MSLEWADGGAAFSFREKSNLEDGGSVRPSLENQSEFQPRGKKSDH